MVNQDIIVRQARPEKLRNSNVYVRDQKFADVHLRQLLKYHSVMLECCEVLSDSHSVSVPDDSILVLIDCISWTSRYIDKASRVWNLDHNIFNVSGGSFAFLDATCTTVAMTRTPTRTLIARDNAKVVAVDSDFQSIQFCGIGATLTRVNFEQGAVSVSQYLCGPNLLLRSDEAAARDSLALQMYTDKVFYAGDPNRSFAHHPYSQGRDTVKYSFDI